MTRRIVLLVALAVGFSGAPIPAQEKAASHVILLWHDQGEARTRRRLPEGPGQHERADAP
jgi:hypothetical protein